MTYPAPETVPIKTQNDVVIVRQKVRTWAMALGLGLVDQTKVVTAASELARNTLEYGLGGVMGLEIVDNGIRRGLRLMFEDHGPGIPDIGLAMSDGYTSGGGLGMGLPGSKRLMSDLVIDSKVGVGTTIVATKWK